MCINSMPWSMVRAERKVWKPSIGRTIRLTARYTRQVQLGLAARWGWRNRILRRPALGDCGELGIGFKHSRLWP